MAVTAQVPTINWGGLRRGDKILDATDVEWMVTREPGPIAGTDQVRLMIMRADDEAAVPIVKRSDEAVRVSGMVAESEVDRPEPDDVQEQAEQTIRDAGLEPEELASESAAEGQARTEATPDEPLVLPVLADALELRSHLYLVHGVHVSDIPEGPEASTMLRRLHDTSHETGPMAHPHLHREADK
jgi:hypothetical protein